MCDGEPPAISSEGQNSHTEALLISVSTATRQPGTTYTELYSVEDVESSKRRAATQGPG